MPEADHRKICFEYGEALREDLAGLLGVELGMKGPVVDVVSQEQAAEDGNSVAMCRCSVKEGGEGSVYMVLPKPDALTLGSLLMGFDQRVVLERREGDLDEDMLDAIGEVMNMSNAILGRMFEQVELPSLQREEPKEVANPIADPGFLEAGMFKRARWELNLPEYPDGRFDLLIPAASNEAWFGETLNGAGGRAGAAAGGAAGAAGADAGEDPGSGALVIIEGVEEEPDLAESLEASLGRAVLSLDPAQVGAEMFEELTDAAAIIVDWDLGHCSGLDVLHALRGHDVTRKIPVGLASATPTRGMVQAAIRSGATTFLYKPLEPDEIRARFGWPGAASEPEASEPAEATSEPQEGEAAPAS